MTRQLALFDLLNTADGLAPGARIGVAVSGGSDSMALLHLLAEWGRAELYVATVDHGLRPEAADEAAFVAKTADHLGVPHTTLRWRGWDGQGNLQDAARRARYGLLAGWSGEHDLSAVALGHTRDDQAETLLMRLARGAGVDGLSAMRAHFSRDGATYLRPLLAASRTDLRSFLEARGVGWIEDPSNADEGFDRVRARQALRSLEPMGLTAASLAEVAAHMADARDALNDRAARIVMEIGRSTGGDLVFDRTRLRQLLHEDWHRILSAALRWVSGADYPPRAQPVDALARAVAGRSNTTLHGCLVMVSDMTVRITREHAAVAGVIGATDTVWDGRWRLTGPHAPDLEIRALGEALRDVPDWRATGLPRASLLASPSVWRGNRLISAPVAGLENGWKAQVGRLDAFISSFNPH